MQRILKFVRLYSVRIKTLDFVRASILSRPILLLQNVNEEDDSRKNDEWNLPQKVEALWHVMTSFKTLQSFSSFPRCAVERYAFLEQIYR